MVQETMTQEQLVRVKSVELAIANFKNKEIDTAFLVKTADVIFNYLTKKDK